MLEIDRKNIQQPMTHIHAIQYVNINISPTITFLDLATKFNANTNLHFSSNLQKLTQQ